MQYLTYPAPDYLFRPDPRFDSASGRDLFLAEFRTLSKPSPLVHCGLALRNDFEVVNKVIEHFGSISHLEYAGAALLDDADLMEKLILLRSFDCLLYASKRLRSDEQWLKKMFTHPKIPRHQASARLIGYLDDSLLDNQEFMLFLLGTDFFMSHPQILDCASERLRSDLTFVNRAVRVTGWCFPWASESARSNLDLMVAAMENIRRHRFSAFESIYYAVPAKLRDTEEFCYAAIAASNGGGYSVLKYSSPRLRNSKDVVIAALNRDSFHEYPFVSDALKRDPEVIALAIYRNDGKRFYGMTADYQPASDLSFLNSYLSDSTPAGLKSSFSSWLQDAAIDIVKHVLPIEIKMSFGKVEKIEFTDSAAVLAAYEQKDHRDPDILLRCSAELRNDRALALQLLKHEYTHYKYLSESLRDDEEIAFASFEHDTFANVMEHCSFRLRGHAPFVQKVMTIPWISQFEYASDSLRSNKDFVQAHPNLIWYADWQLTGGDYSSSFFWDTLRANPDPHGDHPVHFHLFHYSSYFRRPCQGDSQSSSTWFPQLLSIAPDYTTFLDQHPGSIYQLSPEILHIARLGQLRQPLRDSPSFLLSHIRADIKRCSAAVPPSSPQLPNSLSDRCLIDKEFLFSYADILHSLRPEPQKLIARLSSARQKILSPLNTDNEFFREYTARYPDQEKQLYSDHSTPAVMKDFSTKYAKDIEAEHKAAERQNMINCAIAAAVAIGYWYFFKR